jgi:hypothetical protein
MIQYCSIAQPCHIYVHLSESFIFQLHLPFLSISSLEIVVNVAIKSVLLMALFDSLFAVHA